MRPTRRVIAGCLLAVEFNVLNVFPGNPVGQLLLVVPAFYFTVALVFLLNDLALAAWKLLKRKRRQAISRRIEAHAREGWPLASRRVAA